MPKDIAVCMGESGETTSLYEKGKIIIYRKKLGEWKVLREKEIISDKGWGMQELRKKMKDVLDFLDDCKIFVGLSVVGVPYFELEKSRCSVWEFAGKPMEFLDYILEKEEITQQEAKQEKNNINLFPVETSSGCYRISIKDIQEKNIGITSKQVLLPFLSRRGFYSLEVVCNHIPPWLEVELSCGDISWRAQKTGENEIRIFITKKCCHDG